MAINPIGLNLPKIPTFDELLKQVKQPKVAITSPVGDLMDANGAAELGYKIPDDWQLKHDTIEGDSLLSPRGEVFKNIKLSPEGRIEDFDIFTTDGKPIQLPTPTTMPSPVAIKGADFTQFKPEPIREPEGVPLEPPQLNRELFKKALSAALPSLVKPQLEDWAVDYFSSDLTKSHMCSNIFW